MALTDTLTQLSEIFTGIAGAIRSHWPTMEDATADTSGRVPLLPSQITPSSMAGYVNTMRNTQLGNVGSTHILQGFSAYSQGELVHGGLRVIQQPIIAIPTAAQQRYPETGGAYYTAGITIPAEPNFIPENIVSGVSIWGKTGTAVVGDTSITESLTSSNTEKSTDRLQITLSSAASRIVSFAFMATIVSNGQAIGISGYMADYLKANFLYVDINGGNWAVNPTNANMEISSDGATITVQVPSAFAHSLANMGVRGTITYIPATTATT